MKSLKRTPIRQAAGRKTNKNAGRKTKRGVVQTAWVLPIAKKCTPSPNKNTHRSPPDADTFISPSQVPSDVESPLGEVFGHNVAVIQRDIERRVRSKISNLSEKTKEPIPDTAAASSNLSFIDDSNADATTLT